VVIVKSDGVTHYYHATEWDGARRAVNKTIQPEVWKFLDGEEDDLRDRAAETLGIYLQVPEFRDRALEMAKADPDPFVRASAVSGWTGYIY
jgi:hypothetical protein